MLFNESHVQPLTFSVTPGDVGFPDLVNYAALLKEKDGILLMKDGSLFRACLIAGPDLDFATEAVREQIVNVVNHAFAQLGDRWMVNVSVFRRETNGYPLHGSFPDPTSLLIDHERQTHYAQAGTQYDTVTVLSLTYRPPSRVHHTALSLFDASVMTDELTTSVQWFESTTREFLALLATQLSVEAMTGETLLSYLRYCVTGKQQRVPVPYDGSHLDCHIAGVDFLGGRFPQVDERHVRVISLTGFPREDLPHMLRFLNDLPLPYHWATRWIPLDPHAGGAEVLTIKQRWNSVVRKVSSLVVHRFNDGPIEDNDTAQALAEDAKAASEAAEDGQERFGFYTSTLVVWHADKEHAQQYAELILTTLQNHGYTAVIEKVNAVEALLGSLPGHGQPNVRRPMLHTHNLACLLPLTSVWQGLRENPNPMFPAHASALAYTRTGSTPFFLNLHVSDVGHTLVIGPIGAGKTTLLAFLMAQFLRYENAQVFCFDRKHGALPITLACGGVHYDIGVDGQVFAPLSAITTPAGLDWASEWVALVCELSGVTITPEIHERIAEALDILSRGKRTTLSDFVMTVQDASVREALRSYLVGGTRGHLIDAQQDSLRTARFQTFELERLMSAGPKSSLPVIAYLCHWIEQRLDGRPTLITIDEGGLIALHALMGEKIEEWFRTLRSKNAAVVFVTQSLADFAKMQQSTLILESCHTKIYLPNNEATTASSKLYYERFGLNDAEIEALASAIPKRDYLYKSPLGTRMFTLDLGPATLSFVGVSDKGSIARMQALHREHGEAWPGHWLASRGLSEAAYQWGELAQTFTLEREVENYAA